MQKCNITFALDRENVAMRSLLIISKLKRLIYTSTNKGNQAEHWSLEFLAVFRLASFYFVYMLQICIYFVSLFSKQLILSGKVVKFSPQGIPNLLYTFPWISQILFNTCIKFQCFSLNFSSFLFDQLSLVLWSMGITIQLNWHMSIFWRGRHTLWHMGHLVVLKVRKIYDKSMYHSWGVK